jgi:hypothetical protein
VVGLHHHPKLEFASLSSTGGTVGELLNSAMDPLINFDDLAEIRKIWPYTMAIKGVQNTEDAKRLADLGVDAIVLSNHGGRQLDRAPMPVSSCRPPDLPASARRCSRSDDVHDLEDEGSFLTCRAIPVRAGRLVEPTRAWCPERDCFHGLGAIAGRESRCARGSQLAGTRWPESANRGHRSPCMQRDHRAGSWVLESWYAVDLCRCRWRYHLLSGALAS